MFLNLQIMIAFLPTHSAFVFKPTYLYLLTILCAGRKSSELKQVWVTQPRSLQGTAFLAKVTSSAQMGLCSVARGEMQSVGRSRDEWAGKVKVTQKVLLPPGWRAVMVCREDKSSCEVNGTSLSRRKVSRLNPW